MILYGDLKQWFEAWLEEQTDPVPLLFENGSAISTDIRVAVQVILGRIDAVTDPKRSATARAGKAQLIKIKTAIENGQHDISRYGYTIADKYKAK